MTRDLDVVVKPSKVDDTIKEVKARYEIDAAALSKEPDGKVRIQLKIHEKGK